MRVLDLPLNVWQHLNGLRAYLPRFQSSPLVDYPFSRSDIAMLHNCTTTVADPAIDAQTWGDLLLDQYTDHLSEKVSILGQQALHQRLKTGLNNEACIAQTERLQLLQQNPALVTELGSACAQLRESDTEISELLFASKSPAHLPKWSRHIGLLPWLLPLSLALAFWTPLAWLGVGVALFFLMAIQSSFFLRMQVWNGAMKSVQLMLRVATLLGTLAEKTGEPFTSHFIDGHARASKINRALNDHPELDIIPGGRIYHDWFALGNVRHYFKSIDTILLHQDFLRLCYLNCANLEADLALAKHLNATPSSCWAVRAADTRITMDDFIHPLMQQAAPLSISLNGKGAFISGQNGVGKSTLLRSLGLNLIAARAFGFCYARSARVPALPVYASMQSEDSLLGGESLYIAELRRARELLASSTGPHQGIYLIDEIFRGTNHLESISAAASVLHTLAENCPVIVSSHNLVLAALLADRLTPLCVSATRDNANHKGKSLALRPGVLADTNGLSLLTDRGFDTEITAKASKVANWLAAFLIHPLDCENLLDISELSQPAS
ncbi:MAG: DNA mismatch repair protein MutS [Pseudomonadota bacterium]